MGETERRRAVSSLLPSQRAAENVFEEPRDLPPHVARFLAAWIDLAVLAIVYHITLFLALKFVRVDVNMLRTLREKGELAVAMGLVEQVATLATATVASYAVPAILYNILFEVSPFGATPGKIVLGLAVENRGGETLALDQAIRRFAIKGGAAVFPLFLVSAGTATGCGAMRLLLVLALVGIVVSIVTLLDPFFVLFTQEREALHDMFAGSRVVKRHDVNFIRYAFALLSVVSLSVLAVMSGVW